MARALLLAGAAAAGKSTLCKTLESLRGWRCIEVEARRCWGVRDPVERQSCFHAEFEARLEAAAALRHGATVVASNSLLTVAAYSSALARLAPTRLQPALAALAESSLEAHRLLERRLGAATLVLAVGADEMARRVETRLRMEPQRGQSLVERQLMLHLEAQRRLLGWAAEAGLRVAWTDAATPEALAALAAQLLRGS